MYFQTFTNMSYDDSQQEHRLPPGSVELIHEIMVLVVLVMEQHDLSTVLKKQSTDANNIMFANQEVA